MISIKDSDIAAHYLRGGFVADGAGTGSIGLAFFFNVPPGPITLVATAPAVGRVVSRVSAHVHADALTEVALLPTPVE